ncbi:hypothetical protein N7488_000106 [Penicillium malachiteum]|nr:hypothetical protein N7488_000106 [Penicillium malachiteum]
MDRINQAQERVDARGTVTENISKSNLSQAVDYMGLRQNPQSRKLHLGGYNKFLYQCEGEDCLNLEKFKTSA